MREIKFRAWMKDSKLMIEDAVPIHDEVYGHYCKDFEQDTDRYIKLENAELMQYTGLKDKNDKEIYEGDILRTAKGYIQMVLWVDYYSAFVAEIPGGDRPYLIDSSDEIIGNIHEVDIQEKRCPNCLEIAPNYYCERCRNDRDGA